MSTPKKLQGVETEMTRLKAAWLKLSEDARSFWLELFVSETPQAEVRKQVLAKLKINLRFDSQLNKFRAWLEAQEQRELMAVKIEERKAELLAGGATLEEAQEVLLTEAAAYSTAARDFKLGMKVSSEISKTVGSKLDERKLALLEKKSAAFDEVKKAVNSGGLTPETLTKIERELKLL